MKKMIVLLTITIYRFVTFASNTDYEHRIAICGALSTEQTWKVETSYHYMLSSYFGIGASLGHWSQFLGEHYLSGRGWHIDEEYEKVANFYICPSIHIETPSLIKINTSRMVLFIEPAILDIKDINAACMQEEIFGPILPVLAYDDIQQAVNIIKGKAKPLALYIFNEKSKLNKKLLKEISSGGVCINDTINHIVNKNLPFGGVGKSGMGAYHGKYGFLTFSHCKSVFKKSTRVNVNFIFPPYNEKLLKYIKKIMK